MTEAHLALNRFVLGGRAGQVAPSNPRHWLINQFDRFEPRPAAIAALPSTTKIATGIAEYLGELRGLRREMRAGQGAGEMPIKPDPARPEDALIAGALSAHFAIDPARSLAMMFQDSRGPRPVEGLIRA